jgi:uncharacterized membrane protein YeaQ/YmgE (transglycosylase-associated protein family)
MSEVDVSQQVRTGLIGAVSAALIYAFVQALTGTPVTWLTLVFSAGFGLATLLIALVVGWFARKKE